MDLSFLFFLEDEAVSSDTVESNVNLDINELNYNGK